MHPSDLEIAGRLEVDLDLYINGLGVADQKKTNGLEAFAGSMPFESEAEHIAWNEAMKDCERIDEESWK